MYLTHEDNFDSTKLQLVKMKKKFNKIKELDSSGHPIVGEASRGCLKGWSNGLQRDVTWGHTLTHYLIYLARPRCNLLPTDLARELFHRVCVANVDRSGAQPLVGGGGSSTHSPTVDADVTVECRSGVETLNRQSSYWHPETTLFWYIIKKVLEI